MLSLLHGMIYKSPREGREVSWESQEQAVKQGLSYVRVVNVKHELHRQKLFIPSYFYFAYGEMHCAKRLTKIC